MATKEDLMNTVRHMRMKKVQEFIIKHDNYRRLSDGTRFVIQASLGGFTNGQDNKFLKAYWVLLQLPDGEEVNGEKLDLATDDLITVERHNDIIRRFEASIMRARRPKQSMVSEYMINLNP